MPLIEELTKFRRRLESAGIEPETLPFPLAVSVTDVTAAIKHISLEFKEETDLQARKAVKLFGFWVRVVDGLEASPSNAE